jgi:hypothetical protein
MKRPLAPHAKHLITLGALAIASLVLVVILQPARHVNADRQGILSWIKSTSESSSFQIAPDQVIDQAFLESLSNHELASILSTQNIGTLDPAQVRTLGAAVISRAMMQGKSPEDQAKQLFPSPSQTLAMLARDRDVDDYIENAAEEGAAGSYYQRVVDLAPTMRLILPHYTEFFRGAFDAMQEMHRMRDAAKDFPEARDYKGGITLPSLSTKPNPREYMLSHTYALDIFLKEVEVLPFGRDQKGPLLFSLSDSIVVATDSAWKGGDDLDTYRSGGITPKAGNGAILYSPSQRRYYLYFHLYDVLVTPGTVIPRGYPIGHGGNSGTNAHKKGHGEHLHLEIYDVPSARFLKNYEISDIVFKKSTR